MSEFLLFHGVAIVILILANGFFVAAEFALVSVRETRIEQLIAEHNPGARIVRRLQLATQRGRTLAFLLRPWSSRVVQEPSHALLRLGIEPQSRGDTPGVRLSILKSRGGAPSEWWMDLDAAQAAAGV